MSDLRTKERQRVQRLVCNTLQQIADQANAMADRLQSCLDRELLIATAPWIGEAAELRARADRALRLLETVHAIDSAELGGMPDAYGVMRLGGE